MVINQIADQLGGPRTGHPHAGTRIGCRNHIVINDVILDHRDATVIHINAAAVAGGSFVVVNLVAVKCAACTRVKADTAPVGPGAVDLVVGNLVVADQKLRWPGRANSRSTRCGVRQNLVG